jgi:hypothetical protein
MNLRNMRPLVFPVAALLNSFSMTALLLLFGLVGRAETAADIALVQGASLALFYAFSANGRNLVLAGSADFGHAAATSLLQVRLLLLVPLACATYVLAVGIGGATVSLALVLITRRIAEWFGEIAVARHEMLGQPKGAIFSVLAECTALLFCVLLTIGFAIDLAASAVPWALVPLLALRGAGLSFGGRKVEIRTLWPHFGSTGIIGASVYVFRISVALLAGKALAGTLFTAFAIGSLVPTVFGQVLAPTLIRRYGHAKLPYQLVVVPIGMLAVGGALVALAIWLPGGLPTIPLPSIFWMATGLSIAGGSVMSFAMLLRTRLLHDGDGRDVFGPDLLANMLIATCVPFIFYVFGIKSLAALYLLSAFLNLGFLLGAGNGFMIEGRYRRPFQFILIGLLIAPVFFQIDGGLFQDPSFAFDAQGSIMRLPLPLSVSAVFLGIGVLGNYGQASRTLAVLFFSALLFVLTSLVVAEGRAYQEGAKLVLLAQFLLPMFGLVLGEMFGMSDRGEGILQSTACVILLLVLPAQLAASWSNGYTVLSPHVYVFSIYQHLLFFPMIVSALVICAAVGLWGKSVIGSGVIMLLLPVSAVYVFSTNSVAALMGIVLAFAGFGWFHLRKRAGRAHVALLLVAAVSLLVVFSAAKESGWLAKQLVPEAQVIDQDSWRGKLSAPTGSNAPALPIGIIERLEHWRFFYSGLLESSRSFLVGHAVPPDRSKHPSALNYWLDTAYNFGAVSLVPLFSILIWTLYALWKERGRLSKDSAMFGLALAVLYLLFFANMLKVGMRQPYSGIITFFLWGLLIARLRSHPVETVHGEGVRA